MRTASRRTDDEPIGEWEDIVEAIWAINYVSGGFKGFLPRLQSLNEPLSELNRLIPTIQQKSMLDVLERELNQIVGQFRLAVDHLASQTEQMHDLSVHLEKRRAAMAKEKTEYKV